MDKNHKNQFIEQMQREVRHLLRHVEDVVNDAADGNLVDGSEMAAGTEWRSCEDVPLKQPCR